MNLRTVSCFVAALALCGSVSGCGGGQEEPGALDLGGGLSMTADGTILDTARPAPPAAR